MKFFSLILKIVIGLILLVGIALGSLLIFSTVTDFQPEEKIKVEQSKTQNLEIAQDSTMRFSALIWNIGYCGLGAEMDFFYDDGENVITPLDKVKKYQNGVISTLQKYANTDFVLLQEVDFDSKRSHNENQRVLISEQSLPKQNFAKALNFDVKFIPIPFTNPLGDVQGGLVSYSKYTASENTRYQFPGNYSWPTRLYMLDRCFLFQRFQLPNNKDLVVINTHNSAYDDGTLKSKQMDYLKNILLAEYGKGNYVIVGGDWNQTPPAYDNKTFQKSEDYIEQVAIDKDFMPKGWNWAFDDRVPTNRKLSKPYKADKTFQTVIDFFLTSPNITIDKVEGVDLDFQFSDHQPVLVNFSLK